LWDSKTAKGKGVLRGRPRAIGTVTSLAFSPDGKTLASGGLDVRLWDVAQLKEKSAVTVPDCNQPVVGFDANGKALALGRGRTGDGNPHDTAYVHDAETGKVVLTLKGHAKAVGYLAFSPDGKVVHTAGFDHTLRTWSLTTGKQLCCYKSPGERIADVAFSPDGKIVAVSYKQIDAKGNDSHPARGKVR